MRASHFRWSVVAALALAVGVAPAQPFAPPDPGARLSDGRHDKDRAWSSADLFADIPARRLVAHARAGAARTDTKRAFAHAIYVWRGSRPGARGQVRVRLRGRLSGRVDSLFDGAFAGVRLWVKAGALQPWELRHDRAGAALPGRPLDTEVTLDATLSVTHDRPFEVAVLAHGQAHAALGSAGADAGASLSLELTHDPGTILRETVRPGTFTPFGASCRGTAGTPVLEGGKGAPTIGSRFEVVVRGDPGMAFGLLVVGRSRTSWGPWTLPRGLSPWMPGCMLRVGLDLEVFAGATGGIARFDLPIPDAYGASVFVQGFAEDDRANPVGLVATNAATLVIGHRP